MPEFVATRDGAEKQDCERDAVKRWFDSHHARLAPLRPIFLGDDLFACHPVAKMVADAGDDFIFTCKEASHKALYDFIDGAELSRHEEKVRRRARPKRRSVIAGSRPFRSARARTRCSSTGSASKSSTPRANQIFHGLGDQPSRLQGLRRRNRRLWPRRWKIENESFNVLKNHGYELEHNFGHGQKFLAMTLAALNLLAFAWHAVLEQLEPPWQTAREAAAKRTTFFAHILMLTAYIVFPSWQVLLEALTNSIIPPELVKIRDGP